MLCEDDPPRLGAEIQIGGAERSAFSLALRASLDTQAPTDTT